MNFAHKPRLGGLACKAVAMSRKTTVIRLSEFPLAGKTKRLAGLADGLIRTLTGHLRYAEESDEKKDNVKRFNAETSGVRIRISLLHEGDYWEKRPDANEVLKKELDVHSFHDNF